MIRLEGGPGDGLHLAIEAKSAPKRIVFDPDAITITATRVTTAPDVGALYQRARREAGDWLYHYEE